MHTRAEARRTWHPAFARRTNLLASARADALPDRSADGRRYRASENGDAATRLARPASTFRRIAAAPAHRLALALLGVAALYRLLLMLRGWPLLDSDEAIIGLMARHILHGQFDYWFWGQQYMGAFQAYVVAGVFAVLGSSAFATHLSMLLFTLGFLAAMYGLGRAAYGPAVGLFTLAWLAIGPPIGVLRELTAIGGYQDILLFGSLILLGVWSRLRQPFRRPRTAVEWRRALLVYAGIGLAGGIGLWSDLLILPVLFLAAYTLLAVRTREMFSVCGLVLVVAFLCGGFPYISYNITNKNATYKEIVRQTHSDTTSAQATLPAPGDWLNQIGETVSVAVPTILASPHVCINQGSVWPSYPPAGAGKSSAASGACDTANTAFSLAVVLLYLAVAWQLALVFRRWLASRVALLRSRRARSAASGPADTGADMAIFTLSSDDTARLWLRLMMLGTAAMTLALYTTNLDAQRYQFTSSRYLLPLYLTTPLLFGSLWSVAKHRLRPLLAGASHRAAGVLASASIINQRGADAAAFDATGGHMSPDSETIPNTGARTREREAGSLARGTKQTWGKLASLLAAVALLVLLALSVGGGIATLAYAFDSQRFALPEPHSDQNLIAFLDAHHISAYYSDYWTCYRILFETNERITCAVRGQSGAVGLQLINNRNDAYIRDVAAVAYPAYILPAGTPEDHDFTLEAAAEHLPHTGYRRVLFDGYAIYYHP